MLWRGKIIPRLRHYVALLEDGIVVWRGVSLDISSMILFCSSPTWEAETQTLGFYLLGRRSLCMSLESAMVQHVEVMGILEDLVSTGYQSPNSTCQRSFDGCHCG